MSEACLKLEKTDYLKGSEEPTLMDIYKKMNQLELENKILKADKFELQKEVIQLRSDNEVLHNKLNKKENDDPSLLGQYETSHYCGCESEEELNDMLKAYNNSTLRK